MSLKLINTSNYGKKTKALYLKQKNVNLVIKSLVGEVSDNRSVGMRKGNGG